MELNEMLLNKQIEWQNSTMETFFKEFPHEIFSDPFSYGVCVNHPNNGKHVMLIGQQAKDFVPNHTPLNELQDFTIRYYSTQVLDAPGNFNRSAFWKFFRRLNELGAVTSWNNLDKLHLFNNNITSSLNTTQERFLHQSFGEEKISLLMHEIEVVQPDVIVFLTGPNYFKSMASAFSLPETLLLSRRPNMHNPVQRIEDLLNLTIPVFWTYHPSFLNRKKGFFDQCINNIATVL